MDAASVIRFLINASIPGNIVRCSLSSSASHCNFWLNCHYYLYPAMSVLAAENDTDAPGKDSPAKRLVDLSPSRVKAAR